MLQHTQLLKAYLRYLTFLISFTSLCQQQDSVVYADSSLNNLMLQLSSIDFNHGNLKDSSRIKLEKGDLVNEFEISNSFEYGLLSGYITKQTSPLSIYSNTGKVGLNLGPLPFDFSYRYSTFKNPIGVNNYVRFSLNTSKLNSRTEDLDNNFHNNFIEKINSLESEKGAIQSKLGCAEVYKLKLKSEIGKRESEINKIDLEHNQRVELTDSLNYITVDTNLVNNEDYLNQYNSKREELEKLKRQYDTVMVLYTKAISIYNQYNELIGKLEKLKNTKSQINLDDQKKNYSEPSSSFLTNIKTLDVGLTYPSVSGLSNNNLPIKGVNFEYQQDDWYLLLSSGVTISNINASTNAVENLINNTENSFNQFDFQQLNDERFITNVKSGYGQKENSHIYLGAQYINRSIAPIKFQSDSLPIPMLGLELDMRLSSKYLPNTKLDLVLNKTSNYESLRDSSKNIFNSLFSEERTNAGLFKITQVFPLLKSSIEGSVRIIDPFSDVRSLGIVQNDNIQYQVRSTHKIAKGWVLGGIYRYVRNNLTQLQDSTARVNIVGFSLAGNLLNRIQLTLNTQVLTQNNRTNIIENTNNNYVLGAGLSYEYELADIKNAIVISYNDILISDTLGLNLFRNISFSNVSKFESIINTVSLNYFEMNVPELEQNTSLVLGEKINWTFNQTQLEVNFKYAFSTNYNRNWGGSIRLKQKLFTQFELEASFEKMVLGDFYNYFNRDRFDRFPYAIKTQLTYKLK